MPEAGVDSSLPQGAKRARLTPAALRDPKQVHLPHFMPFFWLGIASILGVVFADAIQVSWVWFLIGALASLVAWRVSIRGQPRVFKTRSLSPWVAVCVALIAGLLYSVSLPDVGNNLLIQSAGKGRVVLTGIVTRPPERKNSYVEVLLQAQSLQSGNALPKDVAGRVLVHAPLGSQFVYGDLLRVTGELRTPTDGAGFSYRSYLKHQGVYVLSQFARVERLESARGSPLLSELYRLRERSARVLDAILPSPENALLKGILLGDETGLSNELKDAYRLTGTAHIIAISGFNMAILAGLVTRFFTRWQGRLKGALLTVLLLGLYTVFVGAAPSVVRAALMGSLSASSEVFGRRGNTLNALGFVTLLMVLTNPHIPWDLGFQFSVLATLALALFADPLRARLQAWAERRFGEESAAAVAQGLMEVLGLTLLAQALVLPLILFHFGEASWVFILANAMVLPLQQAVMVLGLFALIVGLASLPLGQAAAWLVWPFAALTNWLVISLARVFPHPWQVPQIGLDAMGLYYLVFFSLALHKPQRGWLKPLMRPEPALLVLLGAGLFLWQAILGLPDGNLSLRVFGASDAPLVLVTDPAGHRVLLGASLPPNSLAQALGLSLPMSTRQLDALVITECTRDGTQGLDGLRGQVRVKQVWWACDANRIQTTRAAYQDFLEDGVTQARVQAGEGVILTGGSELRFTLGEEGLQSVWLQSGAFTAQILYAKPDDTRQTDLLVYPGELHSLLPAEKQAGLSLVTGAAPFIEENAHLKLMHTHTWLDMVLRDGELAILDR